MHAVIIANQCRQIKNNFYRRICPLHTEMITEYYTHGYRGNFTFPDMRSGDIIRPPPVVYRDSDKCTAVLQYCCVWSAENFNQDYLGRGGGENPNLLKNTIDEVPFLKSLKSRNGETLPSTLYYYLYEERLGRMRFIHSRSYFLCPKSLRRYVYTSPCPCPMAYRR